MSASGSNSKTPEARKASERDFKTTDVLGKQRDSTASSSAASGAGSGGSALDHMMSYRDESTARQKKAMEVALLGALMFHLVLLHIILPEFGIRRFQEQEKEKIRVVRLPPKKKEPPPPEKKIEKVKAKIKPVPDPTPEEPEEFQEPEPEPEIEVPPDADVVFGEPKGPPAPSGPVRLTGAMTKPEIVNRVQPEYPTMARRAGLEGVVILEAIITEEGDVRDVKVLRSAGKSGMDENAVEAVQQWTFTPAKSANGNVIPVIMTLTVRFSLQ